MAQVFSRILGVENASLNIRFSSREGMQCDLLSSGSGVTSLRVRRLSTPSSSDPTLPGTKWQWYYRGTDTWHKYDVRWPAVSPLFPVSPAAVALWSGMHGRVVNLRCWPRDHGVWGSIPTAPVMRKSLGHALNPHHLWPPSSNGYQVEWKLENREMRVQRLKHCIPIPGDSRCKIC